MMVRNFRPNALWSFIGDSFIPFQTSFLTTQFYDRRQVIRTNIDKGRIDILSVKWFVGATCIRPFLTIYHFFIPVTYCPKISI